MHFLYSSLCVLIYNFNYYQVFLPYVGSFSIIPDPTIKSSTTEDCWKISILVNKKNYLTNFLEYVCRCTYFHIISVCRVQLFYILQVLPTSFDISTFISTKKWKVVRAYKIQATHYNLSNVLSTFSCSWRLIHGVRKHFYL